ncbi:MAG: hypothetical protein LC792_29920 [Actinobacteria bacterium]|nr:hypothetical protein [Actinomycetota bacterium]
MNHNARSEPESVWLLNRQWRQGRKVKRNVYAQLTDRPADDDVIIGQMDSEWLAEWVVLNHNVQQRLNDGSEGG